VYHYIAARESFVVSKLGSRLCAISLCMNSLLNLYVMKEDSADSVGEDAWLFLVPSRPSCPEKGLEMAVCTFLQIHYILIYW